MLLLQASLEVLPSAFPLPCLPAQERGLPEQDPTPPPPLHSDDQPALLEQHQLLAPGEDQQYHDLVQGEDQQYHDLAHGEDQQYHELAAGEGQGILHQLGLLATEPGREPHLPECDSLQRGGGDRSL